MTGGATGLVERIAGTKWTVQSTPTLSGGSAFLGGVSCTSATACIAVGYSYTGAFGNREALSERWNGSTWTILPTPKPAGTTQSMLTGVSCTSSTACTAVGGNLSGNILAERWDGSRWTIQPIPAPESGGEVHGVSCTTATACTAVGVGGPGLIVETWNGTTWTLEGLRAAGGELFGVSCTTATACTAVGSLSNSAITSTLAERHP